MSTDPRSNDELNRIIAEWCGWKPSEGEIAAAESWASITEPPEWVDPKPPNYCADLNEVHEAELRLDDKLSRRFDGHLLRLLGFDKFIVMFNDDGSSTEEFAEMCRLLRRATARQRAEALVLVIEEGKR